jgi:hypothetical protein
MIPFVAILGGALASSCHRSVAGSGSPIPDADAHAGLDAPSESSGDGAAGCFPLFHGCTATEECCAPNRCLNVTGTLACQQEGPAPDADPDPFLCSTVAPLVLSDPLVIAGTVAAGQTVTAQITLTDTDPNGYVSYPGIVLTSSTSGVTFAPSEAGPPGSYIDGGMSKPITFSVKLAASIPAGTEVQISARAYGWGHPAPDCNGFVLSFSLTTM